MLCSDMMELATQILVIVEHIILQKVVEIQNFINSMKNQLVLSNQNI
nr:MAG TPA: hypothetical protein [Caudoviricetes sp.]